MSQASSVQRRPYVPPAIRDYGDLLEVTANIGGTFSDVPQGSPTGTGCGGGASCFSSRRLRPPRAAAERRAVGAITPLQGW